MRSVKRGNSSWSKKTSVLCLCPWNSWSCHGIFKKCLRDTGYSPTSWTVKHRNMNNNEVFRPLRCTFLSTGRFRSHSQGPSLSKARRRSKRDWAKWQRGSARITFYTKNWFGQQEKLVICQVDEVWLLILFDIFEWMNPSYPALGSPSPVLWCVRAVRGPFLEDCGSRVKDGHIGYFLLGTCTGWIQ